MPADPLGTSTIAETPGPQRSERTSDVVARRLRRMILTLELPPGSSYTEAYLTDLLKCGRAPLREAIQRLAQEHLVVADPRRSVSVSELSLMEHAELVELVTPLWELFARWAAERITDEEVEQLGAVLAEAEQADLDGDLAAVAELNAHFHELIVRASKNRFAVDSILPLLLLQSRFTFMALRRLGSNREALGDHRRIVEALRKRDPDESQLRHREEQERMRERLRNIL
jgi:DNA-binding GntR family transcriptional regulator